MNDTVFSNGFNFNTFLHTKPYCTDNSLGVTNHYFAYMISGKCKIVTDSETVRINSGEFFYIPDKCKYRSYWDGSPEIKFVSLGFLYLPNFGNVYPPQAIPYDSESASLFLRIAEKKVVSAQDIGVLYTLIGRLLPKMKNRHVCKSRETFDKAQSILWENPFMAMPEVAKNCAVSEASLYASFKKNSSLTPNELKCEILLENAKDALITTDKSVEDICDELKFSSSSYFRKKFKEHFGLTPTQMRKTSRI